MHLFHELHTMNQGRPGCSSYLCLKQFKNLQLKISESLMIVIAYKFTVLLVCSFLQLLPCFSKMPYF